MSAVRCNWIPLSRRVLPCLVFGAVTLLATQSAEATCGDYLAHGLTHEADSVADTIPSDAPHGDSDPSRCSGGRCQQAPGQMPTSPVTTLPSDAGAKNVAESLRSMKLAASTAGRLFGGPHDDAAPEQAERGSLDRPPRAAAAL